MTHMEYSERPDQTNDECSSVRPDKVTNLTADQRPTRIGHFVEVLTGGVATSTSRDRRMRLPQKSVLSPIVLPPPVS